MMRLIFAMKISGLGPSEHCMDMDRFERGACLKCDRGDGNLLHCSQFGCPISLHKNCTNGGPKFDNEGNFYCPYCWYKHEVVRTQELRRKAMEAKKALVHFIDFKRVGGDREKENRRTDERKELYDTMDNDLVKSQFMEVEEDQNDDRDKAKLADTSEQFKTVPLTPLSRLGEIISDSPVKIPGAESPMNSTSEEISSEEKISKTRELEILEDGKMIQVEDAGQVDDSGKEKIVDDQLQEESCNACVEGENVVDGSLNISKEDAADPVKLKRGRCREEEKRDPKTLGTEMSDSDMETISVHQRHLRKSSRIAQSQNFDSPKRLSSPTGATPKKIARPRKEKVTASKKSTQQLSVGKFTGFKFANEKRKRLLWTAEEEDMLKEGVHKFSSNVNKNLPWRKVLEFGRHVFDPSRTPADLKDKWRNMLAKESSGVNRR